MWRRILLMLLAICFLVVHFNAYQLNTILRRAPLSWQIAYHSASSSNANTIDEKKQVILAILEEIIDPETGSDILASGRVVNVNLSDDGKLDLVLKAKAAKTATLDQIKQYCILQLSMLEWIGDIDVKTEVAIVEKVAPEAAPSNLGIKTVKHVIAVSSCKGGVGKSTTAVNLAYTLKMQGYRVGILDADIYGPSLPTMTRPDLSKSIYQGQVLAPLEYEGVQLMSMGFLSKGAAIMRGPMVNQVLNQLVSLTGWDNLDYLILDMPPGTGDIQLTLAQIMNISAAVIVTTPQKLSFVDVVKGIDMFDTVNVPSIAVVENMAEYAAYEFTPDFYTNTILSLLTLLQKQQQQQHEENVNITTLSSFLQSKIEQQLVPRKIFGPGHLMRLRDMWGMEHLLSLPLTEQLTKNSDIGVPYVLQYPNSMVAKIFDDLATRVVNEVDRLSKQSASSNIVSHDNESNMMIVTTSNGQRKCLPSRLIRCACRCAVCVEELTGHKLLKDESVADSIRPVVLAPIGRYAMSVDWSDGHKSLYPFKLLRQLAEDGAITEEDIKKQDRLKKVFIEELQQ